MSWEWSHTNEAYRDAELNLQDMPIDELRIIWAEWYARDGSSLDDDKYYEALELAKDMCAASLTAIIWDNASEQRTCDNGGFNAWLCPFGCGPHLVAFDRHSEHHGNDYC